MRPEAVSESTIVVAMAVPNMRAKMTDVDLRINDGGAACGGSPVIRITTTIGSNLNTLSVRVLICRYSTRFPIMGSQVDSNVRFGVRHMTSDRFDQTA